MTAPNDTRRVGATLAVEELTVAFNKGKDTVVAVDNVTLTAHQGEFLCLMGPSGCGKTTLLNVAAGYLPPSNGRVLIDGRPVTAPGSDRAVVFQDDAVFPWMTVEDNIGFSLTVRGMPRDVVNSTVERYLRLIHLEEFRRSWPGQLSGGMRKRVDLARGWAADPSVLLLDEPFGALDIMTKEYLQEELYRLWLALPRTVIFVTHDVEEALFFGDRVAVMSPRPGRIVTTFELNFPRERDRTLKLEPAFVEMRRKVQSALVTTQA